MKRLLFASIACLGLIVASAYLLVTPAFAFAGVTAQCLDGSTISCSGTNCQSGDTDFNGGDTINGYCSCSGPGGKSDVHYCNDGGDWILIL
ncbi:MAG: hypothetical protein M3348_13020 [Acidobacteriota bacterium]|nr:hypothetical protein [Acidobacteriota bacterium]